jgi:Fe-Mn family superoxide dismutase
MMILENKINLLTEKINTTDFLLLEMKKIGIEKLPYSQSSLKRFIDAKTMNVHYNGHYKTYVKKLNDALSKKNYGDLELEEIIKSISRFPKSIRNNAGGAFNHALFWKMLSPDKQQIPSELKSKIIKDFGSIIEFKNKFNEESKDRFGSGWCWLVLTKNGKLKVMSTPNQDNPLMNVVEGGGFPLLGLDLWEHAYYLKYQNKKDEYIKNFWSCVNWKFVDELYHLKTKKEVKENLTENIVYTKKEILTLLEQIQLSAFEDEQSDYLRMFCLNPSTKGENKVPFCKMRELRDNLTDEELIENLNFSIEAISKFFNNRNSAPFRKILNVSMSEENMGRTVQFLKIIADFILDPDFSDSDTKKRLNNIKDEDIVSNDFNEVLRKVRELEYSKYEKSFEGDEFDIYQTKLSLEYGCDSEDVFTLFSLLEDIRYNRKEFSIYLDKIKGCIENSLITDTPPIKADIISKKPLYYIDENGEKVEVFESGSKFEVKKMDVEIDSYLSEFFSIFKQSSLKTQKTKYKDDYNKLIQSIFEYVKSIGDDYLDKIKSQIKAIVFDNNILVPIEYVYFYWSNKGQRGCDEKRLSIRFKILPVDGKIETYKYTKNSDILEKNTRTVSETFYNKYSSENICP